MPLELDHVLDLGLHCEMVAVRIEILAATLGSHALDLIRRIDTALCLCENLDIEIGCKDAMACRRRHLLHDDRE